MNKGFFSLAKAIIPKVVFILACLCLSAELTAQFSGFFELGAAYTDNAFQLSSHDLQRNEDGHPDLEFVESADDAIMHSLLYGTYHTQWRWWQIRPLGQISTQQYLLNPSKQRFDFLAGLRVSRRLGELGLFYGYTPEVYVRDYADGGGTEQPEGFSYEKNLWRADLKAYPFRRSTATLQYKLEDFFYNQYFTEYDGDIQTWTFGWQQNFPAFYLDGAYAYKVYETDEPLQNGAPEDASYEANVFTAGLLIKKMELDARYPDVQWRPELDLRFETRYYQGGDDWHAGRTDNLNTTTAAFHFFFGDRWNIKLDYSHLFRNVEALTSSVSRYKEFSENRYGLSVRYQL